MPERAAPEMFRTALVVEDEANLATAIRISLTKLGVSEIHVAPTLAQARAEARAAWPELVLLDRMLPDGDGLQLCRELRDAGFGGTILALTASGSIDARIEGLDSGSDDYLSKPFSWEELSARLRALARRARGSRGAGATVAGSPAWQIDNDRLRIRKNADAPWVELTPLEFKLAAHLMKAGGAIVTREELLKKVWGFSLLPKTRTVDHFLGRLRKHFESNPEEPDHFITVRGAGYRFQG